MTYRILVLIIFSSMLVFSQSTVKAKIGVYVNESGKLKLLKSTDKMKVGAQFRVCVQSLEKEYIYAIYRDNNFTHLLNSKNNGAIYESGKSILLPSVSEFYTIDAKSPSIRVLVVCSKTKIDDIEKVFAGKGKISTDGWSVCEQKLLDAQKKISEPSTKPFAIAGNVRAVGDLFAQLPALSGKEILMRKYEIEVQK